MVQTEQKHGLTGRKDLALCTSSSQGKGKRDAFSLNSACTQGLSASLLECGIVSETACSSQHAASPQILAFKVFSAVTVNNCNDL